MFKGDVVNYPDYEADVRSLREYYSGIRGGRYYKSDQINRNICNRNTCASIKRETPKYCYKRPQLDNICNHKPIEKLTCKTATGNIGLAIDCEPVEKELKICLAVSSSSVHTYD